MSAQILQILDQVSLDTREIHWLRAVSSQKFTWLIFRADNSFEVRQVHGQFKENSRFNKESLLTGKLYLPWFDREFIIKSHELYSALSKKKKVEIQLSNTSLIVLSGKEKIEISVYPYQES